MITFSATLCSPNFDELQGLSCSLFSNGSGAKVLLSNWTGIPVKGARVLILGWPKLLVRECNMMWALTSESHCRRSRVRNYDWPVWSASFGAYAELEGWTAVLEVAEAQTAPITMVGRSLDAIRLGNRWQNFQHCSSHA